MTPAHSSSMVYEVLPPFISFLGHVHGCHDMLDLCSCLCTLLASAKCPVWRKWVRVASCAEMCPGHVPEGVRAGLQEQGCHICRGGSLSVMLSRADLINAIGGIPKLTSDCLSLVWSCAPGSRLSWLGCVAVSAPLLSFMVCLEVKLDGQSIPSSEVPLAFV